MGTYTIFGQTGGAAVTSDTATYTLTMLFSVSRSVTLTGIWWYSPPGAVVLPSACGVFQNNNGTTTGTLIASNTSPTWSGVAGSGWVKCSFPGTLTLTPGNHYNVAVLLPGGVNDQYSATANYWSSGAGSGGLTSGPLTALSNSAAGTVYGATSGQDAFTSPAAALTYPTQAFNAGNYWVDVEVSDGSGGGMPGAFALLDFLLEDA